MVARARTQSNYTVHNSTTLVHTVLYKLPTMYNVQTVFTCMSKVYTCRSCNSIFCCCLSLHSQRFSSKLVLTCGTQQHAAELSLCSGAPPTSPLFPGTSRILLRTVIIATAAAAVVAAAAAAALVRALIATAAAAAAAFVSCISLCSCCCCCCYCVCSCWTVYSAVWSKCCCMLSRPPSALPVA
jgi:hypothetical protein